MNSVTIRSKLWGVSGAVNTTYHPQMLVDTLASTTTYVKGTTYDEAGRVTRGELGEDEGDPVLVTTYEYFDWEAANGAGRLKSILQPS